MSQSSLKVNELYNDLDESNLDDAFDESQFKEEDLVSE